MLKVRTDLKEEDWARIQVYLEAVYLKNASPADALAAAKAEKAQPETLKRELETILMSLTENDMKNYTDNIQQFERFLTPIQEMYNGLSAKDRGLIRKGIESFFWRNGKEFIKSLHLNSKLDENEDGGIDGSGIYSLPAKRVGSMFTLRTSLQPHYLPFMRFIARLYVMYNNLDETFLVDSNVYRQLTNADNVEEIRRVVQQETTLASEEEQEARESERLRQEEEKRKADEDAERLRRAQESERFQKEQEARESERLRQEQEEAERQRRDQEQEKRRAEEEANRLQRDQEAREAERRRKEDEETEQEAESGLDWTSLTKETAAIVTEAQIMAADFEKDIASIMDISILKILAKTIGVENVGRMRNINNIKDRMRNILAGETDETEPEEEEEETPELPQKSPLVPVPIPEKKADSLRSIDWANLTKESAAAVTEAQIMVADFEQNIDPIDDISILKILAKTIGVDNVGRMRNIDNIKDRMRKRLAGETEETEEEEDTEQLVDKTVILRLQKDKDDIFNTLIGDQNNLYTEENLITLGNALTSIHNAYANLDDDSRALLDSQMRQFDIYNDMQTKLPKAVIGYKKNKKQSYAGDEDLTEFGIYVAKTAVDQWKFSIATLKSIVTTGVIGNIILVSLMRKSKITKSFAEEQANSIVNAFTTKKGDPVKNITAALWTNILTLRVGLPDNITARLFFEHYIRNDNMYDLDSINAEIVPMISMIVSDNWQHLSNNNLGFELARALRIHPKLQKLVTQKTNLDENAAYIGNTFESQTQFLEAIHNFIEYAGSECNDLPKARKAFACYEAFQDNEIKV